MNEMRYAVVIERDASGVSAYVPDLPGCVAAGRTLEEVRGLIREGDPHACGRAAQGRD
jgi:predicted RNase H-like HicB family nuclease